MITCSIVIKSGCWLSWWFIILAILRYLLNVNNPYHQSDCFLALYGSLPRYITSKSGHSAFAKFVHPFPSILLSPEIKIQLLRPIFLILSHSVCVRYSHPSPLIEFYSKYPDNLTYMQFFKILPIAFA